MNHSTNLPQCKLARLIKRIFLPLVAMVPIMAGATSTMSPGNPNSYGANIGWMNWRPSGADGVVIGEYVCSGYIYGANVGWINIGSGMPANHIQYSNASAADFGVNYSVDPAQPGLAILRGYAYGANIGWIKFENIGNPRLRFSDGAFEGYAYSANCGWISLGNGAFTLHTDSVLPGIDSDSDGMADAFEFQYFGGLAMNGTTDSDGDGMTDVQEYLEGTNPLAYGDRLRITLFSTNLGGTNSLLTWTSVPSRLYQIEVNPDLGPENWTNDPSGIITPDIGTFSSRNVTSVASSERYYRVRAIRPLLP